MHEDLARRHDVTLGADRTFGVVMAAGCLLIALAPLRHGQPVRWLAIIVGLAFGAFALARPRALRPLNRAWAQFGQLLNRVTSPVVLALLYYAVFVPVGLVMRLAGRDALRRRRLPEAASYWVPKPVGRPPSSMTDQF